MRPLRVVIVNDYELVVRGVAAMLAPFSERVEIVDLVVGGLPDGPADIAQRSVDAMILKSTSGEQLVDAFERIHRGEPVAPAEHEQVAGVPTLSEREREVLALLGHGLSNRAIADELYLSVDTVKTHVRNVFAKLEVCNRTQAALVVNEHGLIARRQRTAPIG